MPGQRAATCRGPASSVESRDPTEQRRCHAPRPAKRAESLRFFAGASGGATKCTCAQLSDLRRVHTRRRARRPKVIAAADTTLGTGPIRRNAPSNRLEYSAGFVLSLLKPCYRPGRSAGNQATAVPADRRSNVVGCWYAERWRAENRPSTKRATPSSAEPRDRTLSHRPSTVSTGECQRRVKGRPLIGGVSGRPRGEPRTLHILEG
jgi:hypothetical protein